MNIKAKLWSWATNMYPAYLRKRFGMDLAAGVKIALKANLDKNINPRGVHIGERTWVLNGAFVLAHDHCRSLRTDTRIGHDCVIGINSIIMPGVNIGDEVIVGAGSIVTKDIPSNCVVAGNPAKILKQGVHVHNGKILQ